MTPAELLALADTATPGPWWANVNDLVGGWMVANVNKPASAINVRAGEREVADLTDERHARLIALAPDLARLCAEWAQTFELLSNPDGVLRGPFATNPSMERIPSHELAQNALAKLSELKP